MAARERAPSSRGVGGGGGAGRLRALAAIESVARDWRREEGKEGGTKAEPEPRWDDRSNAWVGLGCAKVYQR